MRLIWIVLALAMLAVVMSVDIRPSLLQRQLRKRATIRDDTCNTHDVKGKKAENPGRAGTCKLKKDCTGNFETYSTGKCPGATVCCVEKRAGGNSGSSSSSSSSHGSATGSAGSGSRSGSRGHSATGSATGARGSTGGSTGEWSEEQPGIADALDAAMGTGFDASNGEGSVGDAIADSPASGSIGDAVASGGIGDAIAESPASSSIGDQLVDSPSSDKGDSSSNSDIGSQYTANSNSNGGGSSDE